MHIHVVGGFLGSGKTTAIISAAQALIAGGKTVGVVTNDQGKYLVDTSFVHQANLPGVEVTGGCFCCNYDNLDLRLDQLIDRYHPDVVFAESVGSCADLVATVIKPMLTLRQSSQAPTSFTVLSDARMLLLFLTGEALPFSDDVNYIFEKQIEEAGLVILNKIDLLSPEQCEQLLDQFQEKFPSKTAIPQTSLSPTGVQAWLAAISSGQAPLPDRSLEIEYGRYGRGEAQLAWVDEEFTFSAPAGNGRQIAAALVETLFDAIAEDRLPVGHVKFYFDDGLSPCKVSLTAQEPGSWRGSISELSGKEIRVLVNARVETGADRLRAVIEAAVRSACGPVVFTSVDAFHPRQPNPTYRL